MNKQTTMTIMLLAAFVTLAAMSMGSTAYSLSGWVRNDGLPVSGAVVRIKGSAISTRTDEAGHFRLRGVPEGPQTVTAWAEGYYIAASQDVRPGDDNIIIEIEQHHMTDNAEYQWISAYSRAGEQGNCQNCHSDPDHTLISLPFDEWVQDAHASSAQNPRFLTMYTGSDLEGHQSPATRSTYSRDYGLMPLPPDPDQPYYGPGYQLDFSGTAGSCGACHVPAAAIDDAYSIDPTTVEGVGAEGVTCDFCHKIWDVKLNPQTGLPYNNRPGVLSFEFRRPSGDHQFFAGPFNDVAPGEDTFLPLQQQSTFCAACHYGVFWDTVIYNSFGEWQSSPYADPMNGQTCQDCHMPTNQSAYFALPSKGAIERDPHSIYSHQMPGASDEHLLQSAVTLNTDVERRNEQVIVTVSVTNDGAGHHVPTDSPLRHLILLVGATDVEGQSLVYVDGPTVPDWGGIGNPTQGYYAGLPGKAFGMILEEIWTHRYPTGAYWNPVQVREDTRLAAYQTDTSRYTFRASPAGSVTVEVSLWFRRAYIELMEQKGWDVPDILMEHQVITE